MGSTLVSFCLSLLYTVQGAGAFTKDEIKNLTYLQVKGTGLANQCPIVKSDTSDLSLGAGKYRLEHLCLEPTQFTVKEQNKKGESEFVNTKLMTRLTYSLDEISGDFEIKSDGSVSFKEEDGIDYAAVTVQLPGMGGLGRVSQVGHCAPMGASRRSSRE